MYFENVCVGGDLDSDELFNLEEFEAGTNPNNRDTDGDGLDDGSEIALGLNPLSADTDGDGMVDSWEVANGLDPLNSSDGKWDLDADGLTNIEEFLYKTNPLVKDRLETIYSNNPGLENPNSKYRVLTGSVVGGGGTSTGSLYRINYGSIPFSASLQPSRSPLYQILPSTISAVVIPLPEISNLAPVIDRVLSKNKKSYDDSNVFFLIESHDPDGDDLEHQFSLNKVIVQSYSESRILALSPLDSGTYRLKAKVRDQGGAETSELISFYTYRRPKK